MQRSLPEILSFLSREWLLPLGSCAPVLSGMSTASVFMIRGVTAAPCFLKIERKNDALGTETQRTGWLSTQGIRVPAILKTFDGRDFAAALMTELQGAAPQRCDRVRQEIIDILAKGIKEIHLLPPSDCPFDETVLTRLARAHDAIERRLVDPEQFDERNRGLAAYEIYERLLAALPANQELVVIHGDADFDNLRIDSHGRLGFLDCGRTGQGDRYVDLVCMTTGIKDHFGPEWIPRFLEAYGLRDWDCQRARFFSDLYELF